MHSVLYQARRSTWFNDEVGCSPNSMRYRSCGRERGRLFGTADGHPCVSEAAAHTLTAQTKHRNHAVGKYLLCSVLSQLIKALHLFGGL